MSTASGQNAARLGPLVVVGFGVLVFVALFFADRTALNNEAPVQNNAPEPASAARGAETTDPGAPPQMNLAIQPVDAQQAFPNPAGDAQLEAANAAAREALAAPSAQASLRAADAYTQVVASGDFSNNPEQRLAVNEQAIYWFAKASEEDAENVTAKIGLAMRLTESAQPMQGILRLRQVATDYPENYRAQLQLGLFALQTNQPSKAQERFAMALAADSTRPEAPYYLGTLLAQAPATAERGRELLARAQRLAKQTGITLPESPIQ